MGSATVTNNLDELLNKIAVMLFRSWTHSQTGVVETRGQVPGIAVTPIWT